MARPPLAIVEWTDAQDVNEQCTIAHAPDVGVLAERVTCGFLVYRDAARLILAHDYDPPDSCGNLTVIPAPWVRAVQMLDPVHPRHNQP